ncbi:hypothetical protein [Synechococcus sp. 1G10]|uniref:hypothetical protein n=1 Tax=Synechococcus sp. 1G10 TaxID=2025605 RepID=UPI00117CA130|nr:hypothetical protein [Synechococcus sp. 1G10]
MNLLKKLLAVGTIAVSFIFPRNAQAISNFSFLPNPVSYQYCNEFNGGTGVNCNTATTSTETLVFTSANFTFDGTNIVVTSPFTATSTIEKPGTYTLTFTNGTYSTATNLLTFTGPNVVFNLSPTGTASKPTTYSISLTNPLIDLNNQPTINSIGTYSLAGLSTVCTVWQNNGNDKCLEGDLQAVPSPFSPLAAIPLLFLGRLRRRYTLPAA